MAGGRSNDRCDGRAPRRWPAGFVGALSIAVAVEVGLSQSSRGVEALSAADWGRARAAASREATAADVLCVGDSLVKCGIIPDAIEARLDCPAYNLAVLGGPPPATYFLLKRALGSGARPRAIVVDAKASQLSGKDYRVAVDDWATLLDPVDALRFARDDRDPGLFGLYLVHLIPSIRLSRVLRKATVDTVAGRPREPIAPWRPVIERQYERNLGAVLFPVGHPKGGPDPHPDGLLGSGEAGVCYPPRWSPHPTNLVYLDRTLALAASRAAAVFLVIPPIHPGVQAERERRGLDEAYVALVRKIGDKYANVTVVDGRHAGFGHGVCFDGRHLNTEGATALSHGLAEVIAASLDGPAGSGRWVALPAYAEPTARLAVEDLDESKAAVSRSLVPR